MNGPINKTDLLRKLEPNEEPLALSCDSPDECATYSTLVWRYNRREGRKEGKYIHISIDYYNAMVWFVCVSWTQHMNEVNHEVPPLKWKKLLKQKKTK